MKRDEEDVRKVMEVVSNWTDPFEPSEKLASLTYLKLSMETPYLCPSEGHKHGRRESEKPSGT